MELPNGGGIGDAGVQGEVNKIRSIEILEDPTPRVLVSTQKGTIFVIDKNPIQIY